MDKSFFNLWSGFFLQILLRQMRTFPLLTVIKLLTDFITDRHFLAKSSPQYVSIFLFNIEKH